MGTDCGYWKYTFMYTAGRMEKAAGSVHICSARMMVLPQLCNPKLVWSKLACGWHR